MTASASVVDLKPCPFCGGAASLHDGMGEFWARCGDCGVTGAMRTRADRAVRDWNERAAPHPAEQDAREAVARVVEDAAREGIRNYCLDRTDFTAAPFVRRILALTQAAPDGWRPIETAPKDGTHFLAYEATGDMFRAAFHREGYLMCFGGQPCVQTPEPDFWMPLPPAPPAQGAKS